MTRPVPVRQDLLLVGGGHAHVGVIRGWGLRPIPGVRVTLVSSAGLTPYSGMLPGLVAGHYSHEEVHLELRRLCRWAGVRFIQATLHGLDLERRRVQLDGRPPLAFDILSLDTGSAPALHEVPGAREHALPVKPVDTFLQAWDRILERFRSRPAAPFRVVNVGAGAGGVEVLLAVRHRLLRESPSRRADSLIPPPEFHLVSGAADFPAGHPPRVRRLVALALARQEVCVHAPQRVVAVQPGNVVCQDGTRLPFELLLWTTQACPPPWLAGSGLALADDGFLSVDATLRSVSHPFVFAAGDVATATPHRRPKAGVFAVRQAPPLGENLRHQLRGEPLRPFRPQKNFLCLISTGGKQAIASRGRLALEGDWVWRWKDRIDRRWMQQYQQLRFPHPSRRSAPPLIPGPSADPMRCGGCGAKLGPEILARALRRLPPSPPRPDILVGLEHPDDAAVTRLSPGTDLVQSVDFLRDFVGDPYLLGRIAANHALGDLLAMNAAPRTAQIIATIPWAGPAQMEEDLFQLLSGADETLRRHQVILVGGHSSESAELAVGLSLQGEVDPARIWRKSGLRPGDALLLTKPVGTGVLLAANARGLARATWMDAAVAAMLQSSAEAARCLRQHQATAVTDVTGFGLVGHLLEMLAAGHVGARLALNTIPLLPGARDCLALNIRSSLHPENRRLAERVNFGTYDPASPDLDILFDPQTAGGLLAGVPANHAEACLAELHGLGYPDASLIGTVEPAPSPPTPLLRL